MSTTPKITIEDLAVKLNGNMWTKGDLKRIYLDRGYNTKKMSTKTYVFEKDGEFIVVCNIDCPSQAYQWIESQEQEVKDSVYSQIEEIIEEETSTTVYVLFKDGSFIDYFNNKFEAGDTLYSNDVYYSESKAKQVIEDNELTCKIKTFSKVEWAEMVSKFVPKEKIEPVVAPVVEKKVISRPVAKPLAETEQNLTFAPGTKVSHARFGKGEIIAIVDADPAFRKLSILFEDGTTKELLERFANLQKVD